MTAQGGRTMVRLNRAERAFPQLCLNAEQPPALP